MRNLIRMCAVMVALSVFGVSQQFEKEVVNGKEAVAREVLVKFRSQIPKTSDQSREAAPDLFQETDVESAHPLGNSGFQLVKSRSWKAKDLVQRFSRHPRVEYVEPNYLVYIPPNEDGGGEPPPPDPSGGPGSGSSGTELLPNDTNFGLQYGLRNVGQPIDLVPGTSGADIGATKAWLLSQGSQSVAVAVIDVGIDWTQPDLSPNIITFPTSFTFAVTGGYVACPPGKRGYDAFSTSCEPYNYAYHGTHVAGIVGAKGNNGFGVTGVNWSVTLFPIKALNVDAATPTGYLIDAIDVAVQAKLGGLANVRVISASWFSNGGSLALFNEINYAGQNGVLFVAAAGNFTANNDTFEIFPSNFANPNCRLTTGQSCYASNVISVAATDNKDLLAAFSDYGASTVSLGAPGQSILSTMPGVCTGEGCMAEQSGTSMATPMVAGSAALILTRCPDLSVSGLKATILNNVDPLPSLAGKTITGGRLNVNKAIRSCTNRLTVSVPGGQGNVTSTPDGISCGVNLATGGPATACSADIVNTSTVTLTPHACTGYRFVSWSGACSGTGSCSVDMATAKSVSASFANAWIDAQPPGCPIQP